jgi:hypothetical protein
VLKPLRKKFSNWHLEEKHDILKLANRVLAVRIANLNWPSWLSVVNNP